MSGAFIIVPCYNEGQAIVQLLEEINGVAATMEEKLTVVVVDDGSNDDSVQRIRSLNRSSVNIRIISLLYNLGHQGAIQQGLLFAYEQGSSRAIVMDGDGEDDPHLIPELLTLRDYDIVNVVRGKRSETIWFRLSYNIYRRIFRIVTKKQMNFGNFCMISERVIEVLSKRTFIHFAAYLSKLGFRTTAISSDRRPRLGGKTKMNMLNLIQHAFRSFAEYGESLLMVFLRLFIVLFLFFIATIVCILYLKLFTPYAILGWASTISIGLLTSALICMGFFVTGVLQLNNTYRNNQPPVVLYKVVL